MTNLYFEYLFKFLFRVRCYLMTSEVCGCVSLFVFWLKLTADGLEIDNLDLNKKISVMIRDYFSSLMELSVTLLSCIVSKSWRYRINAEQLSKARTLRVTPNISSPYRLWDRLIKDSLSHLKLIVIQKNIFVVRDQVRENLLLMTLHDNLGYHDLCRFICANVCMKICPSILKIVVLTRQRYVTTSRYK